MAPAECEKEVPEKGRKSDNTAQVTEARRRLRQVVLSLGRGLRWREAL
jgi:hypothetical protein